jgi:multiple sugar transport system permease protein
MAKDVRFSKGTQGLKDSLISLFLGIFAILWLLPIGWTLWTSLHPYSDVVERGIVAWPSRFTFDNYISALHQMHVPRYLLNTVLIIIPTVIFTLLLSSFVAFVTTSRLYRWQYVPYSGDLFPYL